VLGSLEISHFLPFIEVIIGLVVFFVFLFNRFKLIVIPILQIQVASVSHYYLLDRVLVLLVIYCYLQASLVILILGSSLMLTYSEPNSRRFYIIASGGSSLNKALLTSSGRS
jgi:hypothetical protein